MFKIVHAESIDDITMAEELFEKYAASLGFDLVFQDFKKELSGLPGEYAPPEGCLLLAYDGGRLAGCVALRKIDAEACEMKRLYVRPEFRGKGNGRKLAEAIIDEAKRIGYERMRLDTVSSMVEATALYSSLGFKKIESYCYNPLDDAIFMEFDLKKRHPQSSSTRKKSTSGRSIR
jgi:ribosomal protein S18 acetylase RimI-like enzyme